MPLPPLVEPGPSLSTAELTRYSRHVLVPGVGDEGQRRLSNARVLVVGAGGLGSPVLLYLAAAGVGTLGIVDFDTVDTSNLQRQVVHPTSAVGLPKVDSAAQTVAGTNPHVVVERHPIRLDASNALDLVSRYDLVVDGCDNFPTRYLVNDACVLAGKPLVWGSVLRFDGQVTVFWSAPPEGHRAIQYRDVFPRPPAAGTVPSCAQAGVLGAVCGAVGSAMAIEALKLVMGVGEPLLGRMAVLDALAGTWRHVPLRPSPDTPVITELTDQDEVCDVALPTIAATELAGRLAARERGEEDFDLVDVREPDEHALVAIPGSRLVPQGLFADDEAFDELPRDRDVILYCRSGVRSADVLRRARERGLSRASHLGGGVLAWVDEVDPALPRY
ncbi:molybdopterin-synthase adenylyltransferase MoeB [Actinotalea subterranea]|uniref:molybdopterin-synthase adenylyltransferase MoeB n=1 Tax=Actinotalea subterranea TaxID=2607497 RepID=UPI0011EFE149|nr:molybdopterin-synthase adenylyltransferase MoeB [Actinotalea subterranea]